MEITTNLQLEGMSEKDKTQVFLKIKNSCQNILEAAKIVLGHFKGCWRYSEGGHQKNYTTF